MLEALLWGFHNAKSGLCFPCYETIAEAADCARSTVAEALKALEDAGILVMGAADQAGPGALPGPSGRQWMALAGSEDVECLRFQ